MRHPDADDTYLDALEPSDDADAQIALWSLYELAYRGFDDVHDDQEWRPALLGVRHCLEQRLEATLRSRYPGTPEVDDFAEGFFSYVEGHEGPSLARYVQRSATPEQVLELLRLRSIYHLKESDSSAWVVPRLGVRPKAALVELQYDEYGGGDPTRLHAALFAAGMEACGLRSDNGAYIDEVPVEVLEQNNTMSLFGLHRRLRGAALGHLAAFEVTSSVPSRRMAAGVERLGLAREMQDYYLEHVEADAVHEQLAVRVICAALLEEEPTLRDDVFFGAFTCLDLEDRLAYRLLARWDPAVRDGVDEPTEEPAA